jgi:hypothetical protein
MPVQKVAIFLRKGSPPPADTCQHLIGHPTGESSQDLSALTCEPNAIKDSASAEVQIALEMEQCVICVL